MANSYLITPDSDIYLLKCSLEMDSQHQIDFANATAQNNYFMGLTKVLMDDATYVRKDGRLYFEGEYDDYIGYNYCMYKNKGFSSKWFYAFISNMRYENNNMISVDITTDVYQTWMFDFTLKKSFIERSHVAKTSDTLGAYTYPEGLETGDYIVYSGDQDSSLLPDCVIVGCTIDTENSSQAQLHYITGCYNGLFAGCGYYRFDNYDQLTSWLYNSPWAQEGIVTMFMYPSSLAPLATGSNNKVEPSGTVTTKTYGISRISTLDGYTPKNKKCLCFPYCYIRLSNGVGTSNIYKQEVWTLGTNSEMKLQADAVLCPGGSIRIYPLNYNGVANNYDEGFSLGKYPQLAWQVDLYTNWEVQNGINIFGTPLTHTQAGVYGGLTKGLLNLTSGNPVEAAGNLGQVFNTMQEQYQHSMIPPAINGNINSGDVSAINGAMAFKFERCGIKSEFAHIIDNYFEMFGYKLNSVAVPNTTSRTKWNYIKTIDVNMIGDIPENDMQKLKDLYNRGFTIWHDTSHFMDYSQTNS